MRFDIFKLAPYGLGVLMLVWAVGWADAAVNIRENPEGTAWVTGHLESDGACDANGDCNYVHYCCVEGGGTSGGQVGCAAIDQPPFDYACNYEPLSSCPTIPPGCIFINEDPCTEGDLEDQPANLEAVNEPVVGSDARKSLVAVDFVCGQRRVVGP